MRDVVVKHCFTTLHVKALDPIVAALDANLGAALVLDASLRVTAVTPSARRLVGDVKLGTLAAKALCGGRLDRPVAEALAHGAPVDAIIPSPVGEGSLRVRATPLGAKARSGYVLALTRAHASEAPGTFMMNGFLTADPATKRVLGIVERVATDDATVLVRGETGTGKELVAEALHVRSHRASGPLRAINCASFSATLLESELFGHVRGAFTGATRDVPGHIELAHRGTLFLDEVAEMPLEVQAKLLRVLETRSVIPVGGRDPVPIDVRFVAATHRSLRTEVEAGRFRADLMYRIRVIPIHLPPLRDRHGDIPLLVTHLLAEGRTHARRVIERVTDDAMATLERHPFPGNVRELRNVLAYAVAVGEGPVLRVDDLPPELTDLALDAPPVVARETVHEETLTREARRIVTALERTTGNKTRAAAMLGISRVTLWRQMRELGLY